MMSRRSIGEASGGNTRSPVGRNKFAQAQRRAGVSGRMRRRRRKHPFSLWLEVSYSGLHHCPSSGRKLVCEITSSIPRVT
jgi:hypothetical protein